MENIWYKGYNMFEYCTDALNRYQNDTDIFNKALHIFNTFELQKSLPYTLSNLNRCLLELTGITLDDYNKQIVPGTLLALEPTSEYHWNAQTVHVPITDKENHKINSLLDIYGEQLTDKFVSDITIFCLCVEKNTAFRLTDSLGSQQNMISIDWLTNKQVPGQMLIRLSRADMEYFDLAINSLSLTLLNQFVNTAKDLISEDE